MLLALALGVRHQALGPEHPDVASSLNNLASAVHAQGRYAEADTLYRRALAVREKALGPDHPDVAASLNSLAIVQARAATPRRRRCTGDALAMQEGARPRPPRRRAGLNNLADVLRPRAATRRRRRTTAARSSEGEGTRPRPPRRGHKPQQPRQRAQEQPHAEAESTIDRALAVRERALGPNHPDVATSLNNLGIRYSPPRVDLAQAETLYAARSRCRRALGPDHPDVTRSLGTLAIMLDYQGRYAERCLQFGVRS